MYLHYGLRWWPSGCSCNWLPRGRFPAKGFSSGPHSRLSLFCLLWASCFHTIFGGSKISLILDTSPSTELVVLLKEPDSMGFLAPILSSQTLRPCSWRYLM